MRQHFDENVDAFDMGVKIEKYQKDHLTVTKLPAPPIPPSCFQMNGTFEN